MESILPFLNKKHITYLFLTGALLLLVGLSFSHVLMSIGSIWVASVFILQGDYKSFWNELKSSKITIAVLAYLLIHIVGLLWTEDLGQGLKVLKKLLPFLAIPVGFLSIKNISEAQKNWLLNMFVVSVLLSVLICIGSAWIYGKLGSVNPRELSIFTSHIRLSLFICFSLAIIYFKDWNILLKLILALPLVAFLWIIQSFTGIFLLGLLLILLSLGVYSKTTPKWVKYFVVSSIVLSLGYVTYHVTDYYKVGEKQSTPELTPRGNTYNIELQNDFIENGSYLWSFVSYSELEKSWKQRTGTSIWDKGSKPFPHYGALVRYLNNLGLPKDSDGVSELNEKDIERILAGNPYPDTWKYSGFGKRIRGFLFHYEKSRVSQNFIGNSIAEKIVFQKTAAQLYLQNKVKGVGTGDVKASFVEFYKENYPEVPQKFRRKAHNQYLSELVKFGPTGLAILLFIFYYLWLNRKGEYSDLKKTFLIIIAISCLSENTLDTQAGITFFCSFIGLLFLMKTKD